ncbi:MAG: TlyA family RNA methyltransferase, partial [Devosia sp.]
FNRHRGIGCKKRGFDCSHRRIMLNHHIPAPALRFTINGAKLVSCCNSTLPCFANSSMARKLDAKAERRSAGLASGGRNTSSCVQSSAWPSIAETRSKATQMIEGGLVSAECGGLLTKPSQNVPIDIVLKLAETEQYVSRAALKLVGALDHWHINPEGLVCLDVGTSTGGFTEVLLKRHAAKVYAVDVGHAQLHPRLANHPQIVLMEKTNSKDLNTELIPQPIDLIVCDVSFISLTKALPAALKLASSKQQAGSSKKQLTAHSSLIALIKPQFEVGRENLSKGIVKDESIYPALCANISQWLNDEGWKVIGITDSPILGKEGNKEFLIYATK